MEKLVDFMVVGVQKSATTTMNEYLRRHKFLGMPINKKELHFFDRSENYLKGVDFYHSFFLNHPKEKKWGECTPIYCYWQGVLEKIYKYNPRIKLIMLLRNPVDRAFSHWNMEYTHQREDLPFFDALANERSRLKLMPNHQHRVYSYVDRGKYVQQIKAIWNIFGKDNLLIVKMDDLISSPMQTMNYVYKFLDVPSYNISDSVRLYSGSYVQAKISPKEKAYLRSCFEQEIIVLEKLLGWDCSEWLKKLE